MGKTKVHVCHKIHNTFSNVCFVLVSFLAVAHSNLWTDTVEFLRTLICHYVNTTCPPVQNWFANDVFLSYNE